MSTASTRTITVGFSGDVAAVEPFSAAVNSSSPGGLSAPVTLANGANTITVPTGGTTPTAVTIIPPAGNVNLITLKGVSGDTGVKLHLTDPTSIALDSSVATFVLNAAAQIVGVRLVWS